ncbi:MAG: endonuclease/exonuclease/phosphatase family protein [Cytophagaceae bacterium]|nr:endonuclease/exonuclease/phosphatase family protein [Cytophagaceae bacterium]
MKIITWNCNMAFRKKAGHILSYNPDILIVPECEHPEKLKFKTGIPIPNDIYWIGKNPNKGLGVFSYSENKFTLLECYNTDFKNILPLQVSNSSFEFVLLAIWANNPEDKDGPYVTQIWKAIQHYNDLFFKKNVVLAGDFNSNTIWDRPKREGNHTTVVNWLSDKNIHSTYHYFHKQEQGKESHPTLYMYRHLDKPYHLDYCFVSHSLIEYLDHVEIGTFQDWTQYSDHVPVIVDFRGLFG